MNGSRRELFSRIHINPVLSQPKGAKSMPESTQHKLDRIRPPRVQITYDVETRGSFVKMELPFVVGILADLSGNVPDPNRAPMRDRKYVEIDRDNFNDIMKNIGPKVAVSGGSELKFESL